MSVDIAALQSAQDKGLTVGVIPNDGSQALRLEIDDLLEDADLANLYFLALEAFMSNDIFTNSFSYYEISGIHGQPYRAWDGVENVTFPNTGKPDKKTGYCAHGSVLFPTWHRAYLAQFEQAMFLHAADIAKQLGQEETVLPRFRVPYFDPFLPRQKLVGQETYKYGIPVVFTIKQVLVRRPGSTEYKPMDNPLYQFNFPQNDTKGGFNWTQDFGQGFNKVLTQNTIRGYDSTTTTANHPFVMDTFDNNYSPTSPLPTPDPGAIWRVFFQNQNWITMSNHFDPVSRRTSDYNQNSLEGFHDDIHTYLGCGPKALDNLTPGGHMAYPPFAGFDPVFWLHHCNVDRLLAIWQGIAAPNGDSVSWWNSLKHPIGTYVEPTNEFETPAFPLAPFRKSFDNQSKPIWWTSNDLRDHTKLGYDYPQTLAARNTGNYAQALTAWANDELGWVIVADGQDDGKDPSQKSIQQLDHLKVQIGELVTAFPNPIVIDENTPWDPNEQHISSAPTPQPTVALLKKSAVARKSVPIVGKTLEQALPTHNPTFEQRFGGLKDLVQDGKMKQWNVTFGVDKFALDGSFVIAFFLGDFDPEKEGTSWLHEPNLAGSSAIFASSQARIDSGGCANCAAQQATGTKYYDSVGLTQALVTYWKTGKELYGQRVTSLEPNVIVPFLTRNLHWRVFDVQGVHHPRDTLPSLKVMIYSETVTLPQQLTDRPVFENQIIYTSITDGRPGGLNNGEHI